MNEKPDPAWPSRSLTSHFSETMKDGKLKFWWPDTSPLALFFPGTSLMDNSPPVTSPHGQFPHKKYTWKQRCLALREICSWREHVPTRVPILTQVKRATNRKNVGGEVPWGKCRWGEITRGEMSGRELSMRGKCPGGKAPGGLPGGEMS